MADEREFETVVLAALLHDVGKLLQRGSFGALDVKGPHPQVSADFVSAFRPVFESVADADVLATLVRRHHENEAHFARDLLVQAIGDPHVRTLASLVSLSDNLSSSERGQRTEQWQDFKFVPLAPVLPRLHTVGAEATADIGARLHARPAPSPSDGDMPIIFPDDFREYAEGEMNSLLQAFGTRFRALAENLDKSRFNTVISQLLSIFRAYGSCIPSNTQEEYPDVSLADHLTGTAAIAACIYRFHAETGSLTEEAVRATDAKRFLLVAGDLSGIQRYIFDIATQGAGGVARRLRARSFYVQLIAEVAALSVLDRLNLPVTNEIMAAGGRFYLLVPNLPSASKGIEEAAEEFDRWLMDNLGADISLNVATTAFGDDGFRPTSEGRTGFGTVLRAVNTLLARVKLQPMGRLLRRDGRWNPPALLRPPPGPGVNACPACGHVPVEAEEACPQCTRDRAMGAQLPGARWVGLSSASRDGFPIFGRSAHLLEKPPRSGEATFAVRLNDADTTSAPGVPAVWRYVANHVPAHDGDTLTFEDIAARSRGKGLLGFLKADVDRLGELAVFGLRREAPGQDLDTVSRVVAVSRALETFFSGWVQHLVLTKFKNCYVVFSGGDDLFVVGPWDETLRLAERLRDDFERYTRNPAMTLSAAVLAADPHHPIARAAPEVEDLLQAAKDGGRNRINVFGRVLTWDDWKRVRGLWDELSESGEVAQATSALLYSLRAYGHMWERWAKEKDPLGLRYQPMLAYAAARNIDPRKTPKLAALVERIIAIRPLESGDRWLLDHLALLAHLLILSREGGRQ